MLDDIESFEDENQSLKDRYRSIQAPGRLRVNIQAETQKQAAPPFDKWPVMATAAILMVAVGMLQITNQPELIQESVQELVQERIVEGSGRKMTALVSLSLPSLTKLSHLKVLRESSALTSTARLKSVSLPSMPSSPVRFPTGQMPQSQNSINKPQNPKEYKYV
ncbi:MAG: hypothetical protein KUG75_03100 [Pseudomonadales bacterium]|nr:hypothetical protein [Pseudomonadales bacterium]